MKAFFLLLIFFIVNGCNKPKTVMICGDHVCINKAEANQYFEDNLSIEVKIIEKKINKIDNLIELNLNKNSLNKKEISVTAKNETKQKVKVLSNDEINKIKKNIKIKNKEKKMVKKIANTRQNKKKKITKNAKTNTNNNKEISLKNDNKKKEEYKNKKTNKDKNSDKKIIVDVCTIIEKCSIDEISNFLLKEAKKKNFPDITTRE